MTPTTPQAPKPTARYIWDIAWPSIALFMMSTIAGVIIIRIVAGLGTPAVAAVTAGQRVNFLVVALLMGLGAAATALVARAWGAGDKPLAAAYARLSLRVGLGINIALSLLAIALAEPLATFFQLSDESRQMAVSYIRWLALFGPTQAVVMMLSTACRAVGDAKTPLLIGVFTNAISILGAWALAYGKWGLPAMGISGAAIGWGVAFAFSACMYLGFWMSRRLPLPWFPPAEARGASLQHFIRISMPATIEQLILQGAMLLYVGFVASYGTAAFAAYGVGLNLFSIAMVIALGFSIASSALVGQSLGAGSPEDALTSAAVALRLSLGTMCVTGILSAVFATQIASLLVDDPEVIHYTAQFMLALAVMHPMMAVDFVLAGAMRGAGETRFPLLAGLISIIGIRLPLAAFVAWQELPVIWIYSVFIADQAVKLLLIVIRYRQRRWLHVLDGMK